MSNCDTIMTNAVKDENQMMKKAHDPDSLEMQVTNRTGAMIRQRRLDIEMTQTQLSVLVGTNQQTIARYENGEQEMSIGRLVRIAAALKINPCKLLKGE